jgi:hypothetical protein
MRCVVRSVLLLWISFVPVSSLRAQVSQPIASLELDGEVRPTQLPGSAIMGSPQCDSLGTIYVRYLMPANGSYDSSVAKIEPDGSSQTVSLGSVQAADNHVFIFAADNEGSMYEIVRAHTESAQQPAATNNVEYVRFDSDGELRSRDAFAQEFIPSAFLPLPNGNFFASGIVLKENNDGVSESSVAGIFGADARLQVRLRSNTLARTAAVDEDNSDAFVHVQTVRLGDDGNIYILLGGDHAKVAVVNQAGKIIRQLKLQEPFATDVADDMWISGNRLLVIYQGETDDPSDSFVYVLYDAQSGEVVREYKPNFLATPACFQDGQRLSVLVRQPVSGNVGFATAELR